MRCHMTLAAIFQKHLAADYLKTARSTLIAYSAALAGTHEVTSCTLERVENIITL